MTLDPQNQVLTIHGVEFRHLDLERVVDSFYTRVQEDPILKEPFQSVHDWPEHIRRLTHFWWIKFGGTPYMVAQYNPVPKHYFAGFNQVLLDHWLRLFRKTLEDHLTTEQAKAWEVISLRMGQGLTLRNEIFKIEHESVE